MFLTSSSSRKSLLPAFPQQLPARLFTPHTVLAGLMLFLLASLAHAQIQFNGISGVLPINGETLGAQDHAVADLAGNVYITDPTTNQVFKVDVHGNATVLISASTLFNGVGLSGPDGIAVDSLGNLYIADTYNDRIVTIPAGGTPTLLTVTGANLALPTNLAVDPAGNVYVSLSALGYVYKIAIPAGTVTTVATSPYTLNTPEGIAVDISGAVYIADTGNQRVLKSSNGTTTVIGTGSIALNLPVGVTVDGAGNIFIADAQNSQIVETPAIGTPSIFGTGSEVLSNPDGISFDSKVNAYIMDAGNNRVVTVENSAVNFGTAVVGGSGVTIPLSFTIDPGTQVGSTSITSGGVASADFSVSSTTCTYGTTAASCTIHATFLPKTVGVRKAVLVIMNKSASPLVSVPLNGAATGPILAFTPGILSTVAGTYNEYGAPSVGGFPIATSALLEEPRNVALDDAGNFFFLDYGNFVVRKVTPAGYISTVLGDGYSAPWFNNPNEGDCGPALNANISALWGMGIDAADNIYIADYGMNQIREKGLPVLSTTCTTPPAPLNQDIYTFAGIWDPYYERTPYGGDGGPALSAELTRPWAVLPDNAGNVYVSDYGNSVVRKIAPNGVISTVAGNNAAGNGYSGDGQPAVLAQLNYPEGLALDGQGDLFITDYFNNLIRKVTPDGIISTVAGNFTMGAGYSGDNGPATNAQLQYPGAVGIDGGGNLYIADTGNNAIRMVTPGGTISTVAVIGPCNPPNNSELCYTGTAPGTHDRVGPSTGTLTFQPYSIAAAPNGNLYFSDEAGNVIDKIDVSDPPSLTFSSVDVSNGSSQQDVTIQNLGTAPLNISHIAISSNFTFGSDTTCSVSSAMVLDQEQSCILGIAFSPKQTGTISGTVVITDNSQGAPGGMQTIPLSGTGAVPPFGHLDSAGDSVTKSTTVAQSDSVVVAGWAADKVDGAPLSNVNVFIDGTFAGTPTLGIARPDVAAAEGAAYLNSGYQLTYSAAALALGSHSVTVVAIDAAAHATTFGPLAFTVAAAAGGAPPFGNLDSAVDSITKSTNVAQSDSVIVKGWAADLVDSAPLSNVKVYIDGNLAGTPTLAIARPDVAAVEGAAYLNSGYLLTYSAAALAPGSHSVTVIAIDSGSRSTAFGPLAFTVVGAPPFGHIDSAVDSVTTSTTVGQSDSVVVRGWAADLIDGAPLSNVTVYIDGNLVGTPTLGIGRPDVAAVEGAAYLNSGYQLAYPAAALALGSHSVTVIAIDSGANSTTFGPLTFTVAATAGPAPPTPPFGSLDSALDSVTKGAIVAQSDSVVVKGWAADLVDGAPLSNVKVYIDGNLVATPTLGIARPDVAAVEGAAYLNSGYQLSYSAAALALGSHSVTVIAIDSGARSTTFGPLTFTVQ